MLTFCLAVFLLVCFDLNTNMVLSAFAGARSKHVIHLESPSLDSGVSSSLDNKVSSPSSQKLDHDQSPDNTLFYNSHNRTSSVRRLSQRRSNISRLAPIIQGGHPWTRQTGRRSYTRRNGERPFSWLAGIRRASIDQVSDNYGPTLFSHLVKRQTESITVSDLCSFLIDGNCLFC